MKKKLNEAEEDLNSITYLANQKLEIQKLIDQLGSALEKYYIDSEVEVEDNDDELEEVEVAIGMIRRGYSELEEGWMSGSQMIEESLGLDDEEEDYVESTQYDNVILESNKWMYGEVLNEAKDKNDKPEKIAAAIKKWVDKKKPYETTDNGTEKYEMNIEVGKPSPIGFNGNEIKSNLSSIRKILTQKYEGKFNKVKLTTNKFYLELELVK